MYIVSDKTAIKNSVFSPSISLNNILAFHVLVFGLDYM